MRLLYSWDFPSKDTGVGCNFFLSPGDLLTQGSNLYPLHCRQILYNLGHRRACPFRLRAHKKNVLVLILFQNPCRRWDTTLDKFDVAREIATLSILEVTLGVWNSNLLSGSLLSGVLGTGLPGLGTEHLPGALCSGTGSPALGLCSP